MMIRTKLGEIIEFQRGYDLTRENMTGGQYPVVGSTSIIGWHNYYKSENGIVLGRSGTVGKPQLVLGKYWPHNTCLFSTDLKGNYLYYLYYLLTNFDIGRMKSGSNIPTLNRNDLYPLSILFEPDVNEQKKTVSILKSVDLKIITNSKVNAELESMTKTLYDYWFLQFEFPNEEGKPYKSSGGKMVWNDEIKREIPEGWSIENLKYITTLSLGGTPSRNKKEYWENGEINWLNSGEISNFPIITSEEKITRLGLENSATEYMQKGTVVISITGNIRASILAIDSCANQSVVGISESGIFKKEYLYPAISMLLDQFTKISTGNCQQHINKKTIEKSKTLIPPDSILQNYYLQVEPLYSAILNNAFQNRELSSLRDLLLPLLMNGQVTFKD